MRERISKSIWGLIIVVLGALLLAENLGYINSIRLGDWWWTGFIIIPCLTSIVKYGFHVHNVVGLLIGVWLFLDQLNLLPEDYFELIFWPVVLVIVGLSLLFGGRKQGHYRKTVFVEHNGSTKGIDINDKLDYTAVFSAYSTKNNTQSLKGGEITAVFGGIEVDLSETKIEHDITLEVTGVFGAVSVKMPHGVNVNVQRTPVLGRCASNYINNGSIEGHTIHVDATAVFGSVEIL